MSRYLFTPIPIGNEKNYHFTEVSESLPKVRDFEAQTWVEVEHEFIISIPVVGLGLGFERC
jgi:hypothetical protein